MHPMDKSKRGGKEREGVFGILNCIQNTEFRGQRLFLGI